MKKKTVTPLIQEICDTGVEIREKFSLEQRRQMFAKVEKEYTNIHFVNAFSMLLLWSDSPLMKSV